MALLPDDFSLLQPHLESVTVGVGEVLIAPDTSITHVYFIEHGIVSLIATGADSKKIELALIGREGMIGLPVLLNVDNTPDESRVQAKGQVLSIKTDAIRAAARQSETLREGLLWYAQALSVQIAQTALSNTCYKLEQRLARWLIMCHDRVDGDVLPTTHRFLSLMLGVNRPGLTGAVAAFERAGIIRTKRGNITICDRGRLLTAAGASYGIPEAAYARMILSSQRRG